MRRTRNDLIDVISTEGLSFWLVVDYILRSAADTPALFVWCESELRNRVDIFLAASHHEHNKSSYALNIHSMFSIMLPVCYLLPLSHLILTT